MDEEKTSHPAWKARFTVSVIMLLLAFLGMFFTLIKTDGVWLYWRIVAPIYGALCIGLSLYLRRENLSYSVSTIWHEIVHWIGALLAIFLVSLLVPEFISRFQAGLEVLILLGLATFLAGIYTEPTFFVIGITMGLLVLGMSYLGYFLLPLIAIPIIIIFWLSRRDKQLR